MTLHDKIFELNSEFSFHGQSGNNLVEDLDAVLQVL